MATFLQVVRDIALFLARIGLGGILILHGWRRWQGNGIGNQIAYLQQFGTPFPHYAAWGGTMFELIGGVFLVVGALTPLVAAIAVAEQVLIIAYTSWYKGAFLTDQSGAFQGGYEYSVALGLLALLMVVFGAGRVSVDRLFKRSPRDKDLDEAEPTPPPGRGPNAGRSGTSPGTSSGTTPSGGSSTTPGGGSGTTPGERSSAMTSPGM